MPLILVVGKVLSIHEVEFLGEMADVQVAVETYLDLTFFGTFSGYNHNTVTTLGTVDGCQGGILQNVDRCDIRRGDIVDVVHLETVYNVEGFV